jgi:hypothetical protein
MRICQPPAGVFEDETTTPAVRPPPPSQSSRMAGAVSTPKSTNLISKLGLHARIVLEEDAAGAESPTTDSKGKGKETVAWEASSEKRELSLRERKAQMVLQARR